MKTSELTGAALNWAVAKCEGRYFEAPESFLAYYGDGEMNYSTEWAQGGSIIEREMVQLTPHCMFNPLHGWAASFRSFDKDDDIYALHRMRGKTPLLAAMRCYVTSKLGDTVEIPEELQNAN